MNLDSLSREVKMICRACGNDEFEYDDAVGDLTDASDETELKCTHCGLVTTKGELWRTTPSQSAPPSTRLPKTSRPLFRKSSTRP